MLGSETQQRVREALRQLDHALVEEAALENAIRKNAQQFREMFFSAFGFVEQESLQMQEIMVKLNRPEANQLQVLPRGRAHFAIHLDPELAFEHKPHAASRGYTQTLQSRTPELSARFFALFLPPRTGLLRTYTIFADGTWKRTTYTLFDGQVQAKSTLVPRFTAEMLSMEAVDLVGYACLVHPIWSPLAELAATMTAETLKDRTRIKSHLIHSVQARRIGAVPAHE